MESIHQECGLNDTYYGIDSEFFTSKKKQEVYSIQVSDGKEKLIFRTKDEFLRWYEAVLPRFMFAFNLLPELGSFQLWGMDSLKVWPIGCQTRGSIIPNKAISKRPILLYDVMPISFAFGQYKLESLGEFLGYQKLPNETDCKGCQQYPCPLSEVRWKCEKYAIRDADIVVKFIDFCREKCDFDIRKVVSTASIAQKATNLPVRMKRRRKTIKLKTGEKKKITYTEVPPIERKIRECATFAGRSEAFWTGFIEEAYYNDITSLYPLAILVSQCLSITGVEECTENDLDIYPDLGSTEPGWILGHFRTSNDLWGLPTRTGKNIVYVTGEVFGFYNTWDLAAADAKILEVHKCYKAKRGSLQYHEKYEKFFWDKLDPKTPKWRVKYDKGVLNGLSGKLGQRKPCVSNRTNFPAYSALLAKSHQLMSYFFDYIDARGGKVYGMDTDSAFSDINLGELKLMDINGYPFRTSLKGSGGLTFIRAKQYLWKDLIGKYYNAYHGWHYEYSAYRKAIQTNKTVRTTKQVKKTIKTQERAAKKLPYGYWYDKNVFVTKQDLDRLFKGDVKRNRESYKSLELAQEGRAIPSKAWDVSELNGNPVFDKLPPDWNAPAFEKFFLR